MKKSEVYLFTTHCLALRSYPEYKPEIEAALASKNFPFERFIRLCTGQRIIPAVYLALEQNGLLQYLSESYVKRMSEVTAHNRQRNLQVLEQVSEISHTLKGEGIAPVFLNGTAHLLDNLYHDPAERIIDHIDLLVRDDNFLKAIKKLKGVGYEPLSRINEDITKIKHASRLSRKNGAADVEIHRLPVPQEFTEKFSSNRIFRNKKGVPNRENCFVPDEHHRVIHNFIHCQLANHGFRQAIAPLRDLYDLFLLSQRTEIMPIVEFMEQKRKAHCWFRFMENQFRPANPKVPAYRTHFEKRVLWYLNHPHLHRARILVTKLV